MKTVLLLAISLFAIMNGSAQTADVSKIDDAKSRLEKLQADLWQLDSDERRNVVAARGGQSSQKGEFETTKQFEERSKR